MKGETEMKFVSKYRRYSITLAGKKFSFVPEGVTGVYFTDDEDAIAALKGSVAFGRDYHETGEVRVEQVTGKETEGGATGKTGERGKKK